MRKCGNRPLNVKTYAQQKNTYTPEPHMPSLFEKAALKMLGAGKMSRFS